MTLKQSELLAKGSKYFINRHYLASRSLSSALPPSNSELEASESSNEKSQKEGRVQLQVPTENSAVVHHADDSKQHQRIWLPSSAEEPLFWNEDVVKRNTQNPHNLSQLLDRIEKQELEGGRYRMKQYGVLHEDPVEDMVSLTKISAGILDHNSPSPFTETPDRELHCPSFGQRTS